MSDDDGWIYGDGYTDTTDDDGAVIDPGAPLFLGTLSFCVFSLLLLPIFIAIGNRRARLRRAQKLWSNLGQGAANNNLDTLIAERTTYDQYPADGLCGCTDAVEDFLDKDVEDIAVCNNNCFSMCNDKSKESHVTNNEISSSDNDEVGCNNCFAMCYDPPENSEEISAIRVHQPLHMNFQPPCTNTCTTPSRKRKSMDDDDDIPYYMGLDESKRTKRNSIHDSPCSIRLAEQPSFCVGTDERSMTPPRPPDSPSPKLKKKKRLSYKRALKKYKRAVNTVTKKKPIHPLSQDPNVPKVTFLDGGFYAPGNVRLHHQILQSQIDREHKLAKRRREEKKAAANAYIPPTVDVSVSFDNMDDRSTHTNMSSIGDEDVTNNDLDVVWGTNSPYHPSKRKQIWDAIVRIARFDHESKRLVKLMAPYTVTALVCNMFAIIDIAIISAMLGGEILSAYLVTGYFLSMAHQVSKGFTDAHATLCAHAVGAGNYFLAGQYLQLAEIGFMLTAFLPLLLMGVFTYQVLAWLNVSDDVAEIGGNFAAVQVFALFIGGLNNVQMQFLSAIDPSNYSNAIEILINASYTTGIAIFLQRNADASLVDLAWIKLSVAVLFIPINIIFLARRGWLGLCWSGLVKANSLKNKEAVKQMMKAGIPLGIGSLIRESEWGVLVIFASSIGQDDVATFAVVRRMFDIFSSLIEGLCCGAELRCAYHMGRGNQFQASRSAYKSLIIGIGIGAALAVSFYGVLGKAVFKLLDYDHIGAEGTQLIPLLCLCSIVMTIGMLGWALLGAQGRVRLATFITMVTSWIVTIPIAAIFVYVKRYDLQGLVAAVTMGYSVSSTVIMYLLIRSNWKKRLKKVLRAASFTAASFSDDESTVAPDEVSDNDIRMSADVGSSPPRISLIISSDSDLYNQLA